MASLQDVISFLSELSSDDNSTQLNARKLIVSDSNKLRLEEVGIVCTEIDNNKLEIDLDQENFYIRVSKEDFLKTCHLQINQSEIFEKSILIIEGQLVYDKDYDIKDSPVFFQNIIYSVKLLNIFKNCIADFDDYANQNLILLSPTKGKLKLTYQDSSRYKAQSFFENSNNNFQKNVEELREKVNENPDFASFVKNSFIETNNDCIFEALTKIDRILITANRNFELYQKRFDFKEFEKGLSESKQDFFNSYTKFQSEILSKINSLPLQFGIYIFLLLRFSEQIYPLIALIILFFIWGCFSVVTLKNLKDDFTDLGKDFDTTLNRITKNSGLHANDLESYKRLISNISDKLLKRLCIFKWMNIFLLAFFLLMSGYFLFRLCESTII